MDLKAYYRKIRQLEATIEEAFPVVKSLATEDGGKEGRLVEVSRYLAAKMVSDGLAELAIGEEARGFRARAEELRKQEEQRRRAAEIQFTILSEADLKSLQRSPRGSRKE